MLRVSALSQSYGAEVVLRDVSFVLSPGERAGLVGPNGAGKSTLLRCIAGLQRPDSGSVWSDPADRVSYLPQYPADELHLSVRAALAGGEGIDRLHGRMRDLETAMQSAAGQHLDTLLVEYAAAREEFERLGGYDLESRMERVITGLALDVLDLEAPVATLSGGNKTKLSLAKVLLAGATIVLLDEPTNYLDLPAVLWLEEFVRESETTYLVVSHDRRFLDRTVGSILEIHPEEHTVERWPGTYSDYAAARAVRERKRLEAYHDQQEEVARIEEDIRRTKEQARGTEARTKSGLGADHARRLAKKVARKAKARERRLEREMEENEIEKPKTGWNLHLADLGRDPIEDNRLVVETRDLRAGYEDREVVRGVDLTIRGRDRVALLGENGSGKSTLIRCLAGALPYGGSVRFGPSVRMGLLSQEQENLPLDRPVLDVFRSRVALHESEARTYLHRFLFTGDEVFKPVGSLSYGQRSKLALALLVLSDANFLVLDEPTSHLDMPALEAMEEALGSYRGPLLLVSHDRSFVETLEINRVLVMEDGALRAVETVEAYEDEIRRKVKVTA